MAKKEAINLEKGVFQKSLLILLVLVAIVAGSAGFYYGRTLTLPEEKLAVENEWITYQSTEGWSLRHPRDVVVNESDEVYLDENTKITRTLFEERNIHKTGLEVGIIKLSEKSSVQDWVADWVASFNKSCGEMGGGCKAELWENPSKIGDYEGFEVFEDQTETKDKQLNNIFIALSEDTILWSRVHTENVIELSEHSRLLQKEILATFSQNTK